MNNLLDLLASGQLSVKGAVRVDRNGSWDGKRIDWVLASGSPRRQELLAAMGVPYRVVVPNVAEDALAGEAPATLAVRLSAAKAQAAAEQVAAGASLARPGAILIAADTLVALEGEVLGKPAGAAEARIMLERLRGRTHRVYSGLAVLDLAAGRRVYSLAVTPVAMRSYADAEIQAYVESGDPLDKAGAYGIQSGAFAPVARIDACYTNVMGLPMCHLYRVLRRWGIKAPVHAIDACPYVQAHGACSWAHGILVGCDGGQGG